MPKVKDKLVIQNNILIAEFMGGKPANQVKDNPIAYIFPFEFGWQETWDEGGFQGSGASSCWDIGDLQYHSSWDWLMPVIEKIEQNNFVDIPTLLFGNYSCNIMKLDRKEFPKFEGWEAGDNEINTHSTSKIEAVYKAVIEFVKYHNEKK